MSQGGQTIVELLHLSVIFLTLLEISAQKSGHSVTMMLLTDLGRVSSVHGSDLSAPPPPPPRHLTNHGNFVDRTKILWQLVWCPYLLCGSSAYLDNLADEILRYVHGNGWVLRQQSHDPVNARHIMHVCGKSTGGHGGIKRASWRGSSLWLTAFRMLAR